MLGIVWNSVWRIYSKQSWNGCWVDLVGVSWDCLGNRVVSKPLHAPYSTGFIGFIGLTCATYSKNVQKKVAEDGSGDSRSVSSTEAFRGWTASRHHKPWDVPDFLCLWTHCPSRGALDLWINQEKPKKQNCLVVEMCWKVVSPFYLGCYCWLLRIGDIGSWCFEICWQPKMFDFSLRFYIAWDRDSTGLVWFWWVMEMKGWWEKVASCFSSWSCGALINSKKYIRKYQIWDPGYQSVISPDITLTHLFTTMEKSSGNCSCGQGQRQMHGHRLH